MKSHLNTLDDLLNRRYMDAVLQDRRGRNENKALISMLENEKMRNESYEKKF